MRLLIIFLVLIVSSLSFPVNGKAENGSFDGVVTIAQTRGGVTTTTLYTCKGDKLRIENTDKSKPEPSNVVDLKGNKLTIIYPHNSTFVVVDLTKTPAPSGAPNLPPGFPALPNMNSAGAVPGNPSFSPPPGRGPAILSPARFSHARHQCHPCLTMPQMASGPSSSCRTNAWQPDGVRYARNAARGLRWADLALRPN